MFLILLAGMDFQYELQAQAREADAEHHIRMTVTGEGRRVRRKRAVTRTVVIDRKEMEATGASNVAEALQHTPGIEIRQGIRGLFLRLQGMDSKHVLILVDGRRVAGRTNDALDLTRIKVEEVERIEIVKGSVSSLYGSDALGGVVNIITRRSKRPISAVADARYGSGRERHSGAGNEARASAAFGINRGIWSNSFVVGWQRGGGYDLSPFTEKDRRNILYFKDLPGYDVDKINLKQGTTGNSFQDLSFSNKTRLRFSPTLELQADAAYRYLDQERVDATPPRRLSDRRNQSHDGSFALGFKLQFRYNLLVRFFYAYSQFQDLLIQKPRGSEELNTRESQNERIQEARLQVDWRINKNHNLTAGGAFLFEELISERLDSRYGFRQRPALFVQHEWKLGKFKILPGLRSEQDSVFGGQTSPRLQVYYRPFRKMQLRMGTGMGFRAPSFKDLYFDFQNPGVGYQVVGNRSLKPERSRTYNGDLDWQLGRKWEINVGAYYNSLSNLIDFSLLPERRNDLSVFQPKNISRAYTRGGHASIMFRLGRTLSAGLGYTHTDTRDLELDVPLDGRARHRATYRLRWRPGALSFSLTGSVYGKQSYKHQAVALYTLGSSGNTYDPTAAWTAFSQNRRLILLETNLVSPQQGVTYRNPYQIVNFRVSYQIGKLYELYVGVDNLLDEYNETLNPMRPRFYYVGFKTRYQAKPKRRGEELRPEMEQGRRLDDILRNKR